MNLYWSSVWTIPGRCSLKPSVTHAVWVIPRRLPVRLSSGKIVTNLQCLTASLILIILWWPFFLIRSQIISQTIKAPDRPIPAEQWTTIGPDWNVDCRLKSLNRKILTHFMVLTKWTEASSYWVDTSDKNIRTSSGFSGTSKSGHFRNWYFFRFIM